MGTGGRAQRLLDAKDTLPREAGFVNVLGQVQLGGDLHMLNRPRVEADQTRGVIVIHLDAAGVFGKKVRFGTQHRQHAQNAVLPGQRVLLQQCFREVLRLGKVVAGGIGCGGGTQLGLQARRGLLQALQQQRVKSTALAVQDHLYGGVMAVGLFVAALTRQRVIDIGHRHDLRGNGDLLPLQPVRVAAPVISLMVPAADGVGRLDQIALLLEGQLVENLRTDRGVGLHRVKFFLRQLAGLVQDGFGNVDLADVVQCGRRADQRYIGGSQLVAVGLLHQRVQQDVGQRLDMQHMQAALAVAEFHDMAQDVDHRGVAFFFFVDLLGHQPDQPLLLGINYQGVDNAAADHGGVKRAADVVACAEVVGALHKAGRILGRDHDDGNIIDPVTFLHHGQHFKAVHLGHHDIEQQQVDTLVRLHGRHSLQAVLRLQNVIAVAQHFCQYRAVHGGIVRNQDPLFCFTHALTCALTKFNLHGEGGAGPHTVYIIVYDCR